MRRYDREEDGGAPVEAGTAVGMQPGDIAMANRKPDKFGLFGMLMLLAIGTANAQQAADPDFDTTVEHPAYPQRGPTVAIDEAHSNFHTADGRYRPFAELLRSDGYEVVANKREFAPGSLDGVDILVIANADAGNLVDPAFTEAECDVVRDWVRAGGSLLLIADHTPFGASAANLAERFGVSMGRGWVFDVTGRFSTQLVFSQENGLLGRHPITRGRNDSETVRLVKSFGGQSLRAPENASGLLRLSDTAREVADTDALNAEAAAYEGDPESGSPGDHSSPVPGRVQGLAMPFGEGRLAVFGEAAMFSAQVVTSQRPNGPVTIRAGMNVEGYDNRQFALNLLHWLSGLLGDR